MFENQPKEPTAISARLWKEFKKDGQTLMEFNGEVKALTDKDKADFREWFEAAGFPVK